MTGADGTAAGGATRRPFLAGAAALVLSLAACAGPSPEALLASGLVASPSAAPGTPAAPAPSAGDAPTDGGEPVRQAASAPGATRIALRPLPETLPRERAEVLTQSMRDMLAAHGYEIVPAPHEETGGAGLYVVDADIVVERPAGGAGEKVGIDWRVSDALGAPVGKISQTAALPAGATPAHWRRQATLAAAAAAEGLTRLVPRRGTQP